MQNFENLCVILLIIVLIDCFYVMRCTEIFTVIVLVFAEKYMPSTNNYIKCVRFLPQLINPSNLQKFKYTTFIKFETNM